MKALVSHLWKNNQNAIVERSLLHCHTRNLHSIMLLESPGQTIRLYVAEPGNELYLNSPLFFQNGMSVGFHPHHCNLTLECVKGYFLNWVVREAFGKPQFNAHLVKKFRFRSAINAEQMGFELIDGQAYVEHRDLRRIDQGQSISLLAHEIHTVITDPNDVSAWLVYEGQEDSHYVSDLFSTKDLDSFPTPTDLYQKPDGPAYVEMLLKLAGLI